MADIIIPPKEVLNVIKITINYIIQHNDLDDNGIEQFISRLLEQDQKHNFSFLIADDPFHPFFLSELDQAKNGKKLQQPTPVSVVSPTIQPTRPTITPLPRQFVYKVPPEISTIQLDLIHLTAQYAAIYGREFLKIVAQTELNRTPTDPLFAFLRPNMPYFMFFHELLHQYEKAVDPPIPLKKRLEQESQDYLQVYANLRAESEHERGEIEAKQRQAAEEKKKENEKYNWTEFSVVQIVTDDEDSVQESVPAPETKIKDQKMIPFTLQTQPKGIMQKSPITGEEVPIEEFQKHLQYNITHPQALKEREMMKERKANQYSSLASGSQIVENLEKFAKRESIAPENPVIWDGNEESIPKAVAQIARQSQVVKRPELKKQAPVIGPTLKKKKQDN